MTDPEEMRRLVENHVAVNMFPEISFEPDLTYSIEGIGGTFTVKRSRSGEFTVKDMNLFYCARFN